MTNSRFKTLGTISCALLLSACAGQQVAVSESIQQMSAQAASQAEFTPEQAIEDAEKQLIEAKNAELEFYAPIHLKQAQESISQAREYLAAPPKDIKNAALMSAIAAQSFISDAYKNKVSVEGNLKESLAHLKVLQSLNAPSILSDDYQSVTEGLIDLVKEIEQGNTADALKEQVDLLEDMAEVEIDTLKVTHLNEAEAFYEKAEDIDADDYAELTFEKAEIILKASNNFIERNYRNREGVKKAGEEALWATKHAYFVALESEKLIQMTAEESEKHVLNVVSLMNRVYQQAYGKDIEPQKLYNTSDALVAMVQDLQQQIASNKQAAPATAIADTDGQTEEPVLQVADASTSQNLSNDISEASSLDPEPKVLPELVEKTDSEAVSLNTDEQGFDAVESVVEE